MGLWLVLLTGTSSPARCAHVMSDPRQAVAISVFLCMGSGGFHFASLKVDCANGAAGS